MTPYIKSKTTKLFCPMCGYNHMYFYSNSVICDRCDWKGNIDDLKNKKEIRKLKINNLNGW